MKKLDVIQYMMMLAIGIASGVILGHYLGEWAADNEYYSHPKRLPYNYYPPKITRTVIKDTTDNRGLISVIFIERMNGLVDTFALDYITQAEYDSLFKK